MKTKQRASELIERMFRQLVERFDPERVILFGSHAHGDAGPDSDVDVLVVMPITVLKIDLEVDLRSALRDFAVPMDVQVTSPDAFQWRKEIPGTSVSRVGRHIAGRGPQSGRSRSARPRIGAAAASQAGFAREAPVMSRSRSCFFTQAQPDLYV